jgi:hypothetical protein
MKPPFTYSPEGERYIRRYLEVEPPSGMETSLNAALGMVFHDKEERLIQRFEGDHYFFGYSSPDKHTDHIRFELFGHSVAIHRDTVERLHGKLLTVVQSEKIDGVQDKCDILVARNVYEITPEPEPVAASNLSARG